MADALLARAGDSVAAVDEATRWPPGWPVSFPTVPIEPRWAAATAVLRRLCVIAGGPGSGKTTTLARVVALLDEQADELAAGRPRRSSAWPRPPARRRPGWRKRSTPKPCELEVARRRSAGISCRYAPPPCTGCSGSARTAPAAFATTATTGCPTT